MKIKVINPNTSQGMTDRIAEAARAVASPGTEIIAWCPVDGPPSIEGHYDEALCVPGLLEAVRQGEADGVDGYVIACFGDPGLQAAREIARTILQINREDGVSVLLVEQNSRIALTISQYAYVLANGAVELEGRSADLLHDPHIQRIYLGA